MVAAAPRPADAVPALALHGIGKRYPGVVALDDVSMTVAAGSVHGLVGENGAGKSTIVKVVSGLVQPDDGEIEIFGTRVPSLSPLDARQHGIAVIPQERQVAGELSLTENLFLERMPRRRGIVQWAAAHRQARRWLDRVGLDVDERCEAGRLRPVEAKLLEIARGLSQDARLMLLDEPTAVIGGPDVERLFGLVRGLRADGVAVLYISHHLNEVLELTDAVSVMRDGRHVGTHRSADLDVDALVRHMLGRAPDDHGVRTPVAAVDDDREPVIRVRSARRAPSLRDVSFDVRPGEILAFTGLASSGRRELARLLAGAERPDRGDVLVDGRPVASPEQAIHRGVVFLPADRKRESLFLESSLLRNIEIGAVSARRGWRFSPRRQRAEGVRMIGELGVKAPSPDVAIKTLSGGNQQKVLLARWLGVDARVFVLDEPTEGIDLGVRAEIYGLLRAIADRGSSVVVFSSDYEEVRAIADRVIVLRRGVVAAELTISEADDERLLALETA